MMSNLISLAERTKSEQREIAQKGGIASGKARKRQSDILKALKALLDGDHDDLTEDGKTHSGAEAFAIRLFHLAVKEGNMTAMKEILDRMYGKSKETIQAAIEDHTEEDEVTHTTPLEAMLRISIEMGAPLTHEQIMATKPGELPNLTPEQVMAFVRWRQNKRKEDPKTP